MENENIHLVPILMLSWRKHSGVNSTQGMLLGAGRDSSGNEPDRIF